MLASKKNCQRGKKIGLALYDNLWLVNARGSKP